MRMRFTVISSHLQPGPVHQDSRSSMRTLKAFALTRTLASHCESPAHPHDRSLRVIAELLRYPFGAAPAAVCTDSRGDSLPRLTGARPVGALQHRHERASAQAAQDPDLVLAASSPWQVLITFLVMRSSSGRVGLGRS